MQKAITVIFILYVISGCTKREGTGRFVLLNETETGIGFKNTLFENDSINGNTFEYMYNGAGVGIADFNNDGLQDIYFAGNMVSSKLYLNQGNLTFKDVTEASNTATNQWCTGVTIIDINGDGLKDIYLCVAGYDTINHARENICFINQGVNQAGIPKFENKAREMGINDDGYSTMGVFFDYDKDADLDLFLLTNSMDGTMRSAIREIKQDGSGESTDRLYRNNGQNQFEDVSISSGIIFEGYGLGVGLSDINQDGWLDIYCANDFLSNDLLYINNQDGTFSEQTALYFKHFTHNGMGMDIGDINNDALPDVMVLDMLPKGNERQKLMIASNTMTFNESVASGYHPQYLRNTLQLNRGKFPDGQYRFSEIAFLAGIYETDWSWAPLIADFDNDGWKDLLITNGFRKDVTNLDYIEKIIEISRFGTQEARRILLKKELDNLEDVKLPNYVFKNNGDLTFSDLSSEWGLLEPTFTNGTAFADFDNDGDLDLILNNLDQEAIFYENRIVYNRKNAENQHYVGLTFAGEVTEYDKIGTKFWLFSKGQQQFMEYSPFRGYKSTMGEGIHFGMGLETMVDSLIVKWPDNVVNHYFNLPVDSTYTLSKNPSEGKFSMESRKTSSEILFLDNSDDLNVLTNRTNIHSEDVKITHTLLHSLSNYGPSLTVGDINNDGLEDVFVGGDASKNASFLVQNQQSLFVEESFDKNDDHHDMGSLLFDADNDGDLDLYIVSGGYRWPKGDPMYQDRLYFNLEDGKYEVNENALPKIESSGSCVISADYDQDGDLDLFIGGRVEGYSYPEIPQSYLLENQEGSFVDRSDLMGATGGKLGMVTSALWTDVNNDGQIDIMVVGEWMNVTVLINDKGRFLDESPAFKTKELTGWWNSINGDDFDNDGDIDYILGNYGLNSFYKASFLEPLEMYASDLDKNGSIDPVIIHYLDGEQYIVHPFSVLRSQVPGIKNRFKTHSIYGSSNLEYSFTREELSSAQYYNSKTMESLVLENVGGQSFQIHALPVQVQFSPVFGTQIVDLNDDGLRDILLVGNSMHEETTFGNYDASLGNVLINKGNFQWDYLESANSGFLAEGDKKAMVQVALHNGHQAILISENGGSLQSMIPKQETLSRSFQLEKDDMYVVYTSHGQQIKKEIYYGEGFLSSSSRQIVIPQDVDEIEVTKFNGLKRMEHIEQPKL